MPEMVKNSKPTQRPTPPGMGTAVDKKTFDQNWTKEVKKHRTQDPFDAIDKRKQERLNQAFGKAGKDKGRDQGRER